MAGVYLSYPFCSQKCTFCNFSSGVFPAELKARYLDALSAEVRAHEWEWRPETVYLGGGTPSTMPAEALASLLALIPGRPWVEATIEAAPGSITPERARAWAASGINRVSLGVQSFNDKEIRRTGRKHTAQTVVDEIRVLQAAGINNFNIDLIAGLSGQTEASWRESLDWIDRLQAPHVSVYMLEVDEDSRLGKELLLGGARYGAPEAPGEDEVAVLYEMAVERLGAMGIARYEISNFARPGFESKHNLKYWKLEPYAGFGADAHSFDGAARSQNPETVGEYLRAFENTDGLKWSVAVGQCSEALAASSGAGFSPAPETVRHLPTEAPRTTDIAQERFFVGLRMTAGITPSAAEWRRFDAPIRRFVEAGLLETEDGVLRLTSRGVLLSNEVFQEFIDL